MNALKSVENHIAPLQKELRQHKLYSLLSEMNDVKLFMEKHIYAVWDFMSLLKALQNELTCTNSLWKPVKNAKLSRFINEIVHGEESDINELGEPKSHFEMYIDAMNEVGADTDEAMSFINSVRDLSSIESDISNSSLHESVKSFLKYTFSTINSGKPHLIASAFTFGREDLIPDMFIEIINNSYKNNKNQYPKLTYYLERHIEVDGDEHGPLSLEMIQELCQDDANKWEEVKTIFPQPCS